MGQYHPGYVGQALQRERRFAKYGITAADYGRMRDRQGNRCAICERHANHGFELVVDHDHATGAVRSLLCNRCNTGLGMLSDNAAHLRRAAEYLEQHGSKPKARDTGQELTPAKKHKACTTCGYKGKPDRLRAGECQRCRAKRRRRFVASAERIEPEALDMEFGRWWDNEPLDYDEYDLMAMAIERSGER
jgi:hypothetical protein